MSTKPTRHEHERPEMNGEFEPVRRSGQSYRRAVASLRLSIAVAVAVGLGAGGMVDQAQAAPAEPQRSKLEARAAVFPVLAAVMLCTRLCPAAGVAAARIIPRTPKQIKPLPAPNPAVAQAFRSVAGSSSGRALGNALTLGNAEAAALMRAQGYRAHHIVAPGDHRAQFARMVLQARGIGPNTASNGVWLHRSVHEPMHTNAYYANVTMVVGKFHFNALLPTSLLVGDLARIGQLLQRGQLPL